MSCLIFSPFCLQKYYGLDAKWGDIEQWMVGLGSIGLGSALWKFRVHNLIPAQLHCTSPIELDFQLGLPQPACLV